MVIKLYISGISGNKEVKKKQQRVQMILDSKQIDYEAIDITEPGKEKDKEFMQQNGKVRESLGKHPLPPQIFNDEDFCGDYEDFDLANEVDELEKFLHIETSAKDSENDSKEDESSRCLSQKQNPSSVHSIYNPYEYHTFKIKYDSVNGLKEEIIITNVTGENIETEEVTKSEVNGVHEAPLDSSENLTEKTSADEVVAPEKEESTTQENKTNDDNDEKENEENVEEKQEEKTEEEAADDGEKQEEVETPKEEKVDNEETSPPSEEKEEEKEDDDKEDKEEEEEKEEIKDEEKEEEKESDEESEKSQDD